MTSSKTESMAPPNIADVEALMVELLAREDGVIKRSALHHLGSGGGRVRAKLALQCAKSLGLSGETATAISAASEMLHNASLVHDDLQDGDEYRRGKTAVWKEFGSNTAICLGDLMVSAAYAAIASAPRVHLPNMIRHMHARVSDLIGGQHADLESHCNSIEDYNNIARMKSGPLLGLPIELCLIAANRADQVPAAIAASDAIAIAYQTTDDISDAYRDINAGGLNFLALVRGEMRMRVELARDHAAEYARSAISIAEQLPSGSGRGMIKLAQKFGPALAIGEAA